MPIKIYNNTNASSYTLIYTADNCQRLEIKKSTNTIPFSLPIVDNAWETSESDNRLITENTEFVHIGGVEVNVSVDFEIGMADIRSMLSLVTNRISRKNKIEVIEWSGLSSGATFIGIIDSVRLKQEGGDPRLTCNLNFLEGFNPLEDMDGV